MNIRKDDVVIVLSGKDKGKRGKVIFADPKNGKVKVQGVNVAKRHMKARKQGDESAIVKMETPIYASKLMRVCPECDNPTRLAHTFLKDGTKVRVCKKCGKHI